MTATFYVGDAIEVMNRLPEKSVDLILTSPPFLALRSYLPSDHPDKALEGGSQATPGEFVDWLIDVVEACARVLAPHGSLCIELGDTYSGNGGAGGDWSDSPATTKARVAGGSNQGPTRRVMTEAWPLTKSLSLIPELFRLTLVYGTDPLTGRQTERWRLRNVVRWVRPNPPVGALGDKFRPATSELMVFCKSAKRYFDLDSVREPSSSNTHARTAKAVESIERSGKSADRGGVGNWSSLKELHQTPAGAPPLDWWNIPPGGYEGAHYACVDDETEALTPNGWCPHAWLADGDLIAAYNQEAQTITWEPATFHRYRFDGELVAIEKRETSQRLTPNHRVIYKTRDEVQHVGTADDLKPSHRLPVAAAFSIPTTEAPSLEMAALIGWFITEGSARVKTANIYQSETANPEHCHEIRRLLKAVGADFTESSRLRANTFSPRLWIEVVWRIRGDIAATLLAYGKRLRPISVSWPEPQAQALFDAMVDGDGHRRTDGRISFVSHDRKMIDMFQALASRLGHRSTIHVRPSGYEITVGQRTWLSLRGTNGVHDPIRREHYKGIVWCPAVPSTFWLARRNGRPFITGNTFPPELCIKPIKAMCPEKVCKVCGEPSRRIVGESVPVDQSERFDRQPALAAHIKERRETAGFTFDDLNGWFGFKAIASHWEVPGLEQGRIPNPQVWPVLKARLALSDGFDDLIYGERKWADSVVESTVTYEHVSDYPSGNTQDATGRVYQRLASRKDRIPPNRFSDCGHDDYRPGRVLDPFGGSGTTALVATGHGRDCILIDLDERNFDLALQRVGPFILERAG